MRIFAFLALVLPACYLLDPDGDGRTGDDDCNPNSAAPCSEPATNDTAVDTAVPCVATLWYADADLDDYGDPAASVEECEQPDGYVADATDCDDGDATSFPGASERCDGADNDCDGDVDETLSSIWYNDADGDGYGNLDESIESADCEGDQEWLVDNGADCDDAAAGTYPGADEFCNDVDDNCDGVTDEDEALDADVWYADADGDGSGDADEPADACEQPEGYVASATDCDDADAGNFPGNAESCDGADNDCDGSPAADEIDDDLDGYNECADADCNDAAIDTFPGAPESCDGADNDCDGFTDESDAGGMATWYYDADLDGYGDASEPLVLCDQPAGYVADATDCDDGDASVNPGATEVCNEIDDDCDGDVDVAADDATVWSVDFDGDGSGSDSYADWLAACDQPEGYEADFSDCDDADAGVNSGATEVYDDLVDNDCNGTIDDSGLTCYPDSDNDTYGDETGGEYEEDGVCAPGFVDHDSDCDDADSTTNPAEDDPYGDGVDSDCNGSAT